MNKECVNVVTPPRKAFQLSHDVVILKQITFLRETAQLSQPNRKHKLAFSLIINQMYMEI